MKIVLRDGKVFEETLGKLSEKTSRKILRIVKSFVQEEATQVYCISILRGIMEEEGLTQNALAELLGVGETAVSKWLNFKRDVPASILEFLSTKNGMEVFATIELDIFKERGVFSLAWEEIPRKEFSFSEVPAIPFLIHHLWLDCGMRFIYFVNFKKIFSASRITLKSFSERMGVSRSYLSAVFSPSYSVSLQMFIKLLENFDALLFEEVEKKGGYRGKSGEYTRVSFLDYCDWVSCTILPFLTWRNGKGSGAGERSADGVGTGKTSGDEDAFLGEDWRSYDSED